MSSGGALSIVERLHTLSKDPDHREYIVKDQGCLPALVMLLGNEDSQVVELCLETLNLLSMNDNNKVSMKLEPDPNHNSTHSSSGGTPTKQQQPSNTTTNTGSMSLNNMNKSNTSFSILINDKLPIKDGFSIKSQATTTNTSATTNNNSTTTTTTTTTTTNNTTPITLSTDRLAATNNTIQTYTFIIKGMNNESVKKQLEDCLVRTKGVISFMIDLSIYQATIRSSLSSDEVKLVIRNHLGLSSSLIIDGQEEIESSPDYLPEPSQCSQQTRKGWGWGSIISFGSAQDNQNNKNSKDNNSWGWGSFSKALFG
eukprot:gene7834-9648_t